MIASLKQKDQVQVSNVIASPPGRGNLLHKCTNLQREDFIVSNTMLPAGGMFIAIFCSSRYGWGQEKFFAEMNAGKGYKIPYNAAFRIYFKWILPALVSILLIQGYLSKFAPELCAKIFG